MARFAYIAMLLASLGTFCAAASVQTQETLQDSILSDKWSWEDCGGPDFPIQIKSIHISPDPPKPGDDLTVTAIGEASEIVEEGAYADVNVKVGRIKILHKEFDLCEEARNANVSIQCPVEKGIYRVEQTVTLPKEIPPAPFKVDVDGYTVDDDDLLCLRLSIDFRKNPFPGRHLFGF